MRKVTDKQYEMEEKLITALETTSYNMGRDFDYVVGVSGSGFVRVGKSVMAQQMGYYVSWRKGKEFSDKNLVYGSKELIQIARQLPPESVIVYDEARED